MATIVLASPKGGAGKTTTAVLLATEFAFSGADVTILDCDPNRSISFWAKKSKRPPPDRVTVLSEVNENNIVSTIRRLESEGQILIIDLEGLVSRLMSRAISQADLVITPMRATTLDAKIGIRTVSLIAGEEEVLNRSIKHAVVFTMTRGILTAQHRSIQRSLQDQGVTIIEPPLMERSAFSAIFTYGGDLRSMPQQGRMDKAIENAQLFAKFVYKLLLEEKHSESRFQRQGRRHPDSQQEQSTLG